MVQAQQTHIDKKELDKYFSCDNCGSRSTYMLVNNILVCRRCGHRSKREQK